MTLLHLSSLVNCPHLDGSLPLFCLVGVLCTSGGIQQSILPYDIIAQKQAVVWLELSQFNHDSITICLQFRDFSLDSDDFKVGGLYLRGCGSPVANFTCSRCHRTPGPSLAYSKVRHQRPSLCSLAVPSSHFLCCDRIDSQRQPV
jgi:hypothetical protein